MQTTISKFMAMLFASILFFGTTACTDDPVTPGDEPQPGPGPVETEYIFEVESKEVNTTYITVDITTKNIAKVFYLVDDEPDLKQEFSALLISTRGKEANNIKEGVTTLTISGFQSGKSYAVHFAASTMDDTFFEEVRTIEFTTSEFEEDITFFDITKDSFKVDIHVPDEVKERGNVLKWGFADYQLMKSVNIYADALNRHDSMHTYFDDDKTFTFDNSEESSYPQLEDGTYNYDAWLYEPIVPGQPTTFMIGEFEYVKEGELGYEYADADGDILYGDYTAGWHEPGWYHALFDYYGYTGSELFGGGPHDPKLQSMPFRSSPLAEEIFTDQHDFWTGYFRIFQFRTELPDKLDGHIDIDDSGLKPNGGTIRLTPSENVAFFLAGIFTDDSWATLLAGLPDNKPETIQWALTSSMAFYSYGVIMLTGNTDLDPTEILLYPDTKTRYRLALVGMGDDNGYAQFYQEHFFYLPEPTKPAPTITVKAIDAPEGEESPYELWYNVKCPSMDAERVMYAYDTKHAWEQAISSSYAYSDIIRQGNYFTSEDIYHINSEEGLNFKFTMLQPDKTYGLGVMAFNDEGTASLPRYVEATTLPEELPARVESSLFSELAGDWTISAEILYTVYNSDTLESTVHTEVRTTPVHIGDMSFDHSVVTESVYAAFESSYYNSMTREQVDAELASIDATLAAYNEKTRNYNRIPCQGYDLYSIPPYYEYSSTAYISPETLFVAAATDRYNYVDAAGLLYDFGPKWYLEVDDAGNVTMPFNAMLMDPALGYSGLYIMGVNSTNLNAMGMLVYIDGQTGHFPVEISDDKNTMTIKPLVYEGEKYYPHCVTLDGSCLAFIQSDITLKRVSPKAARLNTQALMKQPVAGSMQPTKLAGEQIAPAVKGRSTTPLESMKLQSYTKVSIPVVTSEQMEAKRKAFSARR